MNRYFGDQARVLFAPSGIPTVSDISIAVRSWELTVGHKFENYCSTAILKVEGLLEHKKTNNPFSDEQRLANAVLHGDHDAALLLADEVQFRHLQPQGFVSRADLEARIRELEERNADLEREINIRKASGRGGVW